MSKSEYIHIYQDSKIIELEAKPNTIKIKNEFSEFEIGHFFDGHRSLSCITLVFPTLPHITMYLYPDEINYILKNGTISNGILKYPCYLASYNSLLRLVPIGSDLDTIINKKESKKITKLIPGTLYSDKFQKYYFFYLGIINGQHVKCHHYPNIGEIQNKIKEIENDYNLLLLSKNKLEFNNNLSSIKKQNNYYSYHRLYTSETVSKPALYESDIKESIPIQSLISALSAQEEIDELIISSLNSQTNNVLYKYYLSLPG